MQPKVSVIIPCYGVEKYLDRCMETIVNQTLEDIEIILVDDVSPDNVPQMCDEWALKDSRIKVIHKIKNEGLGFARNTGLEIATGEYVAFVDSDDFVSLDMYELLYKKATVQNFDVVYCNCIEYTDDTKQHNKIDVTTETAFIGRDEVDNLLLDMVGPLPEYPKSNKYRASVWHSIYKRSVFVEHKIKFVTERELISEDLVFDIDYLPFCSKVLWIPDVLYYHCYNGESLSHTVVDAKYYKMKDFLIAIDQRLSKVYAKDKYELHFKRFVIFRYLTTLTNAVNKRYQKIRIKDVLADPFWKGTIGDYPFHRMCFRYRLILFCTQHRMLYPCVKIALKK